MAPAAHDTRTAGLSQVEFQAYVRAELREAVRLAPPLDGLLGHAPLPVERQRALAPRGPLVPTRLLPPEPLLGLVRSEASFWSAVSRTLVSLRSPFAPLPRLATNPSPK